MDELYELYQEIILDHNRNPRNACKLKHPTHAADGHNPLCGDELTVYLNVENGTVKDVSFTGQGCAISKASASLMTTVVKGLTLKQLALETSRFYKLLTDDADQPTGTGLDELGDLAALSGVRRFPVRIKCATLPWHALEAALKSKLPAEGSDSTTPTLRPKISTETKEG